MTQAGQCDPEQAPWGKAGSCLDPGEKVGLTFSCVKMWSSYCSGWLELEKRKVWAMPARLLKVEGPQAFPSHVHVPNSDLSEPSHRATFKAEAGGALVRKLC